MRERFVVVDATGEWACSTVFTDKRGAQREAHYRNASPDDYHHPPYLAVPVKADLSALAITELVPLPEPLPDEVTVYLVKGSDGNLRVMPALPDWGTLVATYPIRAEDWTRE